MLWLPLSVVSDYIVSSIYHWVALTAILVFLIVSELPIVRGHFNRNWPLFGEESGFMALAAVMMILGIATMGNLNFSALSQKSLGLAFWRIVISAGVLAMIMSLVNILAVRPRPSSIDLNMSLMIMIDNYFHRSPDGC